MQEKELPTPRVSIVVPVRHGGEPLARTLDSLLGQRFADFELLLVDDMSAGETLERAQSYALRDPRVQILRGDFGGVAASVNAGSSEARGAYVALALPGDVWLPDKLARQVASLDRSPPGVGLVYTWSADIDVRGAVTGRLIAAEERGEVYTRLVYENFVGGPSTVLMRRDCLHRVGGLQCRPLPGADSDCGPEVFFEFLLRMAELYSFELVPDFLVGQFVDASMLHGHRIRADRDVLRLAEARHPRLPARLFRWAMGRRFLEMSERCQAEGADARACWYLMCAALQDRRLVTLAEFHAAIGRQGGRLAERLLGRRPAVADSAGEGEASGALEQLHLVPGRRTWVHGWRRERLQAAQRLAVSPRNTPQAAAPAALRPQSGPSLRSHS